MMLKTRVIAATALLTSAWTLPVLAQEAVTVSITIKDHRFQPAEVKVPAQKPLVLKVSNLDSTAEEFESKTLRVEKVIAGNSEATIRVRPLQPGRYKFVGEFNEATAQGTLIVE